jgi:environmental stress-induced protein Ves
MADGTAPRLLPAATRLAQPWKNGGGTTSTLAQWPEGAGLDAIGWRLSIAEVAAAGPFSFFPGIERHLAMLDGAMELRFAERTVRLDPAAPALCFAGDAAVEGRPLGGPARDLNLMVDPQRFAARLERVAGTVAITPQPGCQHLLVLTAPATPAGGLRPLARHDALWFGPQLAGSWQIAGTGWLATIAAR